MNKKMIVIQGMEMPKNCAECPMTYKDEVDYHICALIGANIDYLDKNEIHPDCPLKEIVTCKDCNHCKDIVAALHKDGTKKILHVCKKHGIGVLEDYFCGDV